MFKQYLSEPNCMALAFDIFFSNCCLGNGRESSRWLEQIEDDFWISLCIFLVPSCSARHCTAHVFHMPVLSLSLCNFKLYTTLPISLFKHSITIFSTFFAFPFSKSCLNYVTFGQSLSELHYLLVIPL